MKTIYKFNELKPEIQKKVFDEYRYEFFDWNYIIDFANDDIQEKMQIEGFNDIKIEHKIECCKVFLPHIYAELSIEKLLELSGIKDRFNLIKDYACFEPSIFFSDKDSINIYSIFEYTHPRINKFLDDAYEILTEKLNALIMPYREDLKNCIIADYKYFTSLEYIEEYFEINGYEFYENGKVYYD